LVEETHNNKITGWNTWVNIKIKEEKDEGKQEPIQPARFRQKEDKK
jgi:hypothetical protein